MLAFNGRGACSRTGGDHSIVAEGTPAPNRLLSQLLLVVIIALALSFAFVVPPFQSNDEHGHFVRVYEISRGHLIGRSTPTLPQNVVALIARYPERLEDSGGAGQLIRAELRRPAEATSETSLSGFGPTHRYLMWGVIGANLYSPITYLPAVTGMWLGRAFSSSALTLVYAARVANALVFGLVMAIAFRLAPQCRALLGALALLPMTLLQVSVISADAVVISTAFLGFALVLRSREKPVRRGLLMALAVFFPIWAICKPSPWTFVATLLIGGVGFRDWRSRAFYLAAVCSAMIATAVAWQAMSRSNTEALRASRLTNGIDMSANVRDAIRHPVAFGVTAASAMVKGLPDYTRQFWGVFGWSKFSGPWWLRGGYLLLLLFVAATESLHKPLSVSERILSAAVFLCGFVFVHAAILLTDAHACGPSPAERFCFDNSAGIQGRYFIPFGLFGLLALKQSRLQVPQPRLLTAVLAAGLIQGAITLNLIAGRFY